MTEFSQKAMDAIEAEGLALLKKVTQASLEYRVGVAKLLAASGLETSREAAEWASYTFVDAMIAPYVLTTTRAASYQAASPEDQSIVTQAMRQAMIETFDAMAAASNGKAARRGASH